MARCGQDVAFNIVNKEWECVADLPPPRDTLASVFSVPPRLLREPFAKGATLSFRPPLGAARPLVHTPGNADRIARAGRYSFKRGFKCTFERGILHL